MANGTTKKIADVREGDLVLATDPETGETSSRTVTDTHVMLHDGDLLDLTIEDDDGAGVVFATDEHRFWSITDETWVPAIELDECDQLRQADGTTATVVDVDERDGTQDMFDLTVDIDHTFYVTTGGEADAPSAGSVDGHEGEAGVVQVDALGDLLVIHGPVAGGETCLLQVGGDRPTIDAVVSAEVSHGLARLVAIEEILDLVWIEATQRLGGLRPRSGL